MYNKKNASLQLISDAQLNFTQARPIPFALQDGVSEKVERLVSKGVLESIDFSPFGFSLKRKNIKSKYVGIANLL